MEEELEAIEVNGTFSYKEDQGMRYSLLLYQPPGWRGGPAGNFVLTEDGSACGFVDAKSGTVDYSGRWELKKDQDGEMEVHLLPDSVEEAFWDDEIGEGDWETRYPYKGESPLVAKVGEISGETIIRLGLKAFKKDLVLKRSE